jgi:hypothetical protein
MKVLCNVFDCKSRALLFLPFVDGLLTVALLVLRGEMRVCERRAIQISSAKKSGKPLPLF